MSLKIRQPFNGVARITFNFGASPDWYARVFGYPHNGVDFGMKRGVAILACDKGKVVYSDSVPDSDGCGIIVQHDWGTSLYWHLSRLIADLGQVVNKGDVIGLSGATGFVTGPHLHFGIKVPGRSPVGMRGWCNPIPYLEGEVTTVEDPEVEPRYYRVKIGDTLWRIAQKFYGEGAFWPKIYQANKDKIVSPGLIFPFQKLLIP